MAVADRLTLDLARAKRAVEGVCDPEIPVLTLADLGVVRAVRRAEDGSIEVTITPTYSDCPATSIINLILVIAATTIH